MSGRRRDRAKAEARGEARRPPLRRLLVCCEGRTEYEYFDGLRKFVKNPRLDLKIEGEKGVPLTIVQALKAAKSRLSPRSGGFAQHDEYWAVFDVDEHPNLRQAVDEARQSEIKCAISNPCFELWICLHHREAPGQIDRKLLRKHVEKLVPGYDKHVDFDQFSGLYPSAVGRATRLAALDDGPVWSRNLCASAHELVARVVDGANVARG